MPPAEPEEEENDLGILCPNCAAANVPEADFCARCRAPLSTMSTIDPLRSTLAEGFVYRQAVEGTSKPIVLVGIWLIFLPGMVVGLLQTINAPERSAFGLGRWAVVSALGVGVLYRTTASFLRKRREEPRETATED